MKSGSILGVGLILAALLPPGLTSFFVSAILGLAGGQFPMIYDPSFVDSALLYFAIVYLLVEVVITAALLRGGSRRLGWTLAAITLVNLAVGMFFFQSSVLCGIC